MANFDYNNPLGKRKLLDEKIFDRESWSSKRIKLSDPLIQTLTTLFEEHLSSSIDCSVLATVAREKINQESSPSRFSKKHDKVPTSFSVKKIGENRFQLIISDDYFLGGGYYKTIYRGLKVEIDTLNRDATAEPIALLKTMPYEWEEEDIDDIKENQKEIMGKAEFFYEQFTSDEIENITSILPPPTVNELEEGHYGKNIEKSWYVQPLAIGGLKDTKLSFEEKLSVFLSLLPLLKTLKEKELSFMDWRPTNILVFQENNSITGKLSDWELLEPYSKKWEDDADITLAYGDSLYQERGVITPLCDVVCLWNIFFEIMNEGNTKLEKIEELSKRVIEEDQKIAALLQEKNQNKFLTRELFDELVATHAPLLQLSTLKQEMENLA